MKILALAFLVTSAYAYSSGCDHFLPYGVPKTQSIKLCRISYSTYYSNAEKRPLFSAELLLTENLNGKNVRNDNFQEDPALPIHLQVDEKDLVSSGFDRGHLAPAEDMRTNSVALEQSFYMSNIVPQNPYMNRGAWKALETYTRKVAMAYGHAYVITGTITDKSSYNLPSGAIVPTYLYKIIVTKQPFQMIAFKMPNTDVRGTKFTNFVVPVSVIEKDTKINFFPALKDKSPKSYVNTSLLEFK